MRDVRHSIAITLTLCLALGCQAELGSGQAGDSGSLRPFTSDGQSSESVRLAERRFDLLTPAGLRVFEASQRWLTEQVNHPAFVQPATCAKNLSRVLEMAGLAGYSSLLVPTMVDRVRAAGGRIVALPKDRTGIIKALNGLYGGRLPAGTLIAGCLNKDCSGKSGDGHIAVVGDVDGRGNILAYHNNWYRPDNAGGTWREHMVSKRYYYDLGYRRQWMATPWLRLERDKAGKIVKLTSSLPAVDDLDPMQYHVTLAIPPAVAEGAARAAAGPHAYWDVAGSWAAPFINRMARSKRIVGFTDGSYRPHQPVTRAETAVLLDLAFELRSWPAATGRGGACPFADLSVGHWARGAACRAWRAGFMAGTEVGVFAPGASVTREQLLVTLAAGLALPAAGDAELTARFDDAAQASGWARARLAAAARAGLVASYPSTRKLQPAARCTGAEAAAFLHQALLRRGAFTSPLPSPYLVK